MPRNYPKASSLLHLPPGVARDVEAIGYAHLVLKHELHVVPHWHWSFVSPGGVRRDHVEGARVLAVYPAGYRIEDWDSDVAHVLFSLRFEGVSLEILAALFNATPLEPLALDLTRRVEERPTGKYIRRLWFLYEMLTGGRLDTGDLTMGNYVSLLDEESYAVGPAQRVRRQRVWNNLLGDRRFCPMVRRTPGLGAHDPDDLGRRMSRIVASHDADLLARAASFLHTKETMSSFAIEAERPSMDRAERFIRLFGELPALETLTEVGLVRLHGAIVEPRFAEDGYRREQVYVGESIDLARRHIHYVAPRPDDVPDMMAGLLSMNERLRRFSVDPVVWAASLAFGFVFIHPFNDGNGRLHRFLIQYALSKAGLAPQGLIIPVSSVMLKKHREYDACLESFSKPLLAHIDYNLDEDGAMRVKGETASFYRYFDATSMAEYLYGCLAEAITVDLQEELDFLMGFARAQEAVRAVIDMPDRLVTLLIKTCRENGGTLSARKRQRYFAMLSDSEVAAVEAGVREAMDIR